MRSHRPRRIGRRTAERLLRGGAGRTASDALSTVLAAAAAPAREHELAGEGAAMAAFRTARLAPVPRPRRRSMLKIALAKLLTVKVAGVAAALTAGGIAVAAATGTLPGRHGNSPTASNHDDVVVRTSTTAGGAPAAADKDSSASPSPSLEGLCHAYTAGAGSEHGKALDNPAFTALIDAAGGKDKVAAYCADLLPDKPGKATDKPTGRETPDREHPSGAPSTRPGR